MKRWQLNPMVAMCVLTGGHIWDPSNVVVYDATSPDADEQWRALGTRLEASRNRVRCMLCGRPWAPTARTQGPPSQRLLAPARVFAAAVVLMTAYLAATADEWWVRIEEGVIAVLVTGVQVVVFRRQRRRARGGWERGK